MSFLAKKRYIDPKTGQIKTNVLWNDADDLPKRHKTFKTFQASFGNVNHYEFCIADCFIVIDIRYAFSHFLYNTYNDNRENLNGTLLPTLHDPILITKDTYEGQDTISFYKAFKDKSELYHMIMFQALKQDNQKYYFKTIYNVDSLAKVNKIIGAIDINTLYFKYEGRG